LFDAVFFLDGLSSSTSFESSDDVFEEGLLLQLPLHHFPLSSEIFVE